MTAITRLDWVGFAQIPAARLLNTTIESVGIALAAWLLLRLGGRQNAGTRFTVWFFALLSIAALPFIGVSATGKLTGPGPSPITIPASWAIYLLGGWAVVSGFCLARLASGLWHIHKLRRGCSEVSLEALPAEVKDIFNGFHSPRRVKLCVSGQIQAPAAVGFLRPAVVIPSWGLTELSADELKVTLLHELAHLQRWDDWTNLVQKAVKAIFFFHPAVWWIEGRLALEREMACDDEVLARTKDPRGYAASLISFAEKIHRGRELALVHAVVGRVKQVSRRVTRILDSKRPRATRIWKPAFGLATVLSGAAVICAPRVPQLVAFQPAVPVVSAKAIPPAGAPVAVLAKQAAFHPAVAPPATPRRLSANLIPTKRTLRSLPQPGVVTAKASPQEIPLPESTFFMQSVGFDAQGAPVVTLSFWRITQDATGRRQVETTYFVSRI